MVTSDDDDDTHFCLKCRSTIIGLDNYVVHRKSKCQNKTGTIAEKCALDSTECHKEDALRADDFFSSLNLQSSSKPPSTPQGARDSSLLIKGVVTRSKTGSSKRKISEGDLTPIAKPKKQPKRAPEPGILAATTIAPTEVELEEVAPVTAGIGERAETEEDDWESDGEHQHIGGKWKNDADLQLTPGDKWKGDTELQLTSGGKWKSDSDLQLTSGGKWKSDSDLQLTSGGKWKGDADLQLTTGGKWKGDSDMQATSGGKWKGDRDHQLTSGGKWKPPGWTDAWQEPPPGHTGGKWRPAETAVQIATPSGSQPNKCSREDEYSGAGPPPPGHTRGKWGPQERQWLSRTAGASTCGSASLYWCGPCHRRLSSRLLYERHLNSELHFKRTRQERQLEGYDSRRPVRGTRQTLPRYSKLKSREMRLKKRRDLRGCRRGEVVCEVCLCKVWKHKMGKHLVSHYHCSRHPKGLQQAQATILNYMPSIVKQAPFQCQMCKFYCNTVQTFIAHWASDLHRQNDLTMEGEYWCLFCKYGTESSVTMGCHLVGSEHREVVLVINRSMPIIIQKRVFIQCDTCHRCFRYNAQLRRHAQLWGHSQVKSTASEAYQELGQCSQCRYTAHSLSSLQKHVRSKHGVLATGTGHYFCRVCNLRFDTAAESKRHRNEASHRCRAAFANTKDKETLTRSCHHCGQVLDQLVELKTHLKLVHPEQSHRCIKCGKAFILKQELSQHVRSKSCTAEGSPTAYPSSSRQETDCAEADSAESRCDKCPFSSKSESELLVHTILHSEPVRDQGEHKFTCVLCSKLYLKNSLMNHVRTHTGERPFSCHLCHLSFSRRDILSKHTVTVHELGSGCSGLRKDAPQSQMGPARSAATSQAGRPKIHVCPQCGDTFNHKGTLAQHLQRHWGKKFRCDIEGCIYSCRSQAELVTHLRTHSQSREFNCANCSYAAKTKGQLAKHVKSQHEEGGEQYMCPHCDFSSKNSSHLNRHLRLHSGAKPYSCPYCPFTCNLLENLRKHVINSKIHPGEYLYACKIESCYFKSNYAKDFKAHLVKDHTEDPTLAASYVTGLYQPAEDTRTVATPIQVKSRRRKRSRHVTELLKMESGGEEEDEYGRLNPTLASVALTPSKSQPPGDDVIFIQVETGVGEEPEVEEGMPREEDMEDILLEQHRRVLGLHNFSNRTGSFPVLIHTEEAPVEASVEYVDEQ